MVPVQVLLLGVPCLHLIVQQGVPLAIFLLFACCTATHAILDERGHCFVRGVVIGDCGGLVFRFASAHQQFGAGQHGSTFPMVHHVSDDDGF